jgi:hypothetical protein
MQPVNRNPSVADVRQFGRVILGGFAVLGALLWCADGLRHRAGQPLTEWAGATPQWIAAVLWAAGAVVAAVTHVSQPAGRRVYVVWMTAALGLGTVMTFVLLSVLFVVLLPVFSLIRFGDPLRLRLRRGASTYWEDHKHHESTLERTIRPF